ncbi:hypothetical protein L7F22_010113 [Adiantum nelumboides]|nr:hypothetical protein [Adiantum nelumboides]
MIWYFDSGASRHITSRKDLFSSLDAAPTGKKVTCANNASYPIKGVGKILITISDGSDLCLPDVLYVPGIKKNLLFVSSLAKNGLRVIFEDDRCIVRDRKNGYSLITTGCKVQTLRTDRGGEYMSGAFKDFLGKKGIKHQCTMPYTPQQNGVAERKNMSLMEMARCMLKAKSLPHKLWMEAVACAAHVLNRCPTRALKTITPYESWYDRKPSVSYLRVFGCLAYAHIPQQLRGKLDDKAIKCIFVGYSSGSKGYRLYNPATNKIFESRDVIFAETTAQPMVAFDVPHMQTHDVFEGFLPSFVENQESQQVDNFDQSFDQHVTPHDVEEIVLEEQEVLREERTLPKWVQKTLQDSKLDAPLPRKTHTNKEEIPKGLDDESPKGSQAKGPSKIDKSDEEDTSSPLERKDEQKAQEVDVSSQSTQGPKEKEVVDIIGHIEHLKKIQRDKNLEEQRVATLAREIIKEGLKRTAEQAILEPQEGEPKKQEQEEDEDRLEYIQLDPTPSSPIPRSPPPPTSPLAPSSPQSQAQLAEGISTQPPSQSPDVAKVSRQDSRDE